MPIAHLLGVLFARVENLSGDANGPDGFCKAKRQVAIKVIEVDEEDTSGFADEARAPLRSIALAIGDRQGMTTRLGK